ncbi:unnamed protein product [Clonostachys byssicola]|uniref:Uncharacterized protein n=1 Tax=Clonostachys byssicola TaxID=160290 RepID=A0A9N9U638_9HYPO|nr:unnamed protein product [Clonostachys byssicola]
MGYLPRLLPLPPQPLTRPARAVRDCAIKPYQRKVEPPSPAKFVRWPVRTFAGLDREVESCWVRGRGKGKGKGKGERQ